MSNDSKQAFTPGPWSFDSDWYRIPTILGANGKIVASVEKDKREATPERAANARLIAAAPEMYEALKKAEQLYQVGLIKAPDGLFNEVNKLRAAALLKATGASS